MRHFYTTAVVTGVLIAIFILSACARKPESLMRPSEIERAQ